VLSTQTNIVLRALLRHRADEMLDLRHIACASICSLDRAIIEPSCADKIRRAWGVASVDVDRDGVPCAHIGLPRRSVLVEKVLK